MTRFEEKVSAGLAGFVVVLVPCELTVDLGDFDVSSVFIPRPSSENETDYYLFKPEIENKEHIRQSVPTDTAASVITQLEHWWDKYRVSLNELDAEVAEAEKVMRGYLKELGYE